MDDAHSTSSNIGFAFAAGTWAVVIAWAVGVVLTKGFPTVGFWPTWMRAMLIIVGGFLTLLSLDRAQQRTYNMLMTASLTVMAVLLALS